MNPKVDGYLRKEKKWGKELGRLRKILLESPLTEDVKWRHPCYTYDNRNVVILGAFKEYCAMTFVKGVLLNDPEGVLSKIGENTQSARVIRFTRLEEITRIEPILRTYINEAIDVEKAGLKVTLKKVTEYEMPEELQKKFDEDSSFETAFRALTPGRQRAYLLHFSSAKQSRTREARIEKSRARICDGKGRDD